MLIFSQDRKRIMDCVSLEITKNFGGKKDEKYAIVGAAGLGSDVGFNNIMALFPDEKTAMDELEKVFAAFAEGASSYKF